MFFSERDFACDFIGEEFLSRGDESNWDFYLSAYRKDFSFLFNFANLELLIRSELCSNILLFFCYFCYFPIVSNRFSKVVSLWNLRKDLFSARFLFAIRRSS